MAYMGRDQSHAPAALPTGEKHPVPIEQEIVWALEPVWQFWKKQNLFPQPRYEAPDSLDRSVVNVPTAVNMQSESHF